MSIPRYSHGVSGPQPLANCLKAFCFGQVRCPKPAKQLVGCDGHGERLPDEDGHGRSLAFKTEVLALPEIPKTLSSPATGDVWLNERDNGHDVRLDGVLLATWALLIFPGFHGAHGQLAPAGSFRGFVPKP